MYGFERSPWSAARGLQREVTQAAGGAVVVILVRNDSGLGRDCGDADMDREGVRAVSTAGRAWISGVKERESKGASR